MIGVHAGPRSVAVDGSRVEAEYDLYEQYVWICMG